MYTPTPISTHEHMHPHEIAQPFTFQQALLAIKRGESTSQCAQNLLSQLDEKERLSLLDGDEPFWTGLRGILCDRYNHVPFVHGAVPRLEIPGIRFTDGPRGVVMGASTAFPVAMARGATWDTNLEWRIGNAIGLEAKAQGANYFAGVCINLPRHPAWGRIQETYSENPLLLGEFGVALTQGVQNHVMACVKHFALNSMENARFRVDVNVDEDVLHEVYLPHFRRVVEAGVASVMSSYNSVNGEWAGQNWTLLTDILRNNWGFNGFTLSDFIFGLRDAALSVQSGLDIEAPFMQQRAMCLEKALQSGVLQWADIDRACLRILAKTLEFETKTELSQPNASVVFCEQHRKLARETASRSMVLLKNESVNGKSLLPIDTSKTSTVAVIGRLANTPNTGDKGSSQVFSPHVVTPFEGLQASLPRAKFVLEDSDSTQRAQEAAACANIAICIVGYDASDEGEYVVPSLQHDPLLNDLFPPAETAMDKDTLSKIRGDPGDQNGSSGLEVGAGGDRSSLRLRKQDVDIINATMSGNKRTVVVIVAAGAVIMEEWNSSVPAILMSWYSGSEGGHGLADVLLGHVDASGRLPFSIPTDESHLPYFDREATMIRYDRWLGQGLLDKMDVTAAYPFGFGLSYTTFRASQLAIFKPPFKPHEGVEETLLVQFTVRNTGSRPGRYVAQVYAKLDVLDFPARQLVGFRVIDLVVGETLRCSLTISLRPIQRWINGKFTIPHRRIVIEVADYSGDADAVYSAFQI